MDLDTPSRLNTRRRWLVCLLVLLGFGLAMLAAWLQAQSNRHHLDTVARVETHRVAAQVVRQVLRVELGLLGARGAALAVGWDALSRDAFLRYSQSHNIDAEFPGVRGIGLIRRVRPAQEADFVARAAADGWPSFAVRALVPHDDERMVIHYIEPVARNREAIGLDIGSEPRRREAAVAALRTGRVTLTGPITLVQAAGQPQAGFLMLLPVYPDARVAADAGQRVERALGWTYAPLAIQEVLTHLDIDKQAWRLRIADVEAVGNASRVTLFHDTASGAAWTDSQPQAVVDTAVAGRIWRISLQASPAMVARQAVLDPRWVGLGGMLVTSLLAGVLMAYLRAEDHARDLRAERERRAVALQTSRDAVVMVDSNGIVFDWNQGAEMLFGYAADEIVGQSALAMLVPFDHQADAQNLVARAAHGESLPAFDTQRLDRTGRRIDVSIQIVPLRDLHGVFSGLALSMRDIRASKEAERTLRRTTTLLNSVLDSSSEVAIIATDAEGSVQVFNRGAERLLGRSAEEMIGRQSHLAFHDRPELDRRRAALSERLGRPATVADVFTDPVWLCRPREWTYVHQDGHPVPVSMILTPMAMGSGDVTGYLAVVIDITRRKEVERRLEQATARAEAANRAKSEFLANMSHEIRSPLNAVLGLTYLLRQTVLDAEQRTFLDRIKLASDALLHTVNDVLDLSKVEAGQFGLVLAPFDLGQTVSDLVEVMGVQAQGKHLPIRLKRSPALPGSVVGDGMRLSQVLTNLLSNAIKFTECGQVDVVIDWRPGDGPKGTARLEVIDTGIGLDAEVIGRVFEPFVQADSTTTRRFGGTGLGLAIARQLVRLMGGQIGVHSTPGVGSTFWAEIPFEVDSAVRLHPVADRALATDALAGRTILVVDDSDVNREVARCILENKGAQVVLAEDGAQAVALIQQGRQPVDLVLMDIHMPDMDGFEATRAIRRVLPHPGLPILALTAGVTSDERNGAQAAGMDDFITKPFDPDRLLWTIVKRLGLKLPPDDDPPTVAARSEEQGPAWPEIAGIDTGRARLYLSQDLGLFVSLLRRFFEVCRPLAAGVELDDPVERARVVHEVHLLGGNAGTLGMVQLHALALDLEVRLREGQVSRAAALVEPMRVEWTRLQAASTAFLAAVPDDTVTPDEVDADAGVDIPPDALEALIGSLNRHSMRATGAFAALAPALRARLGSTAFAALKDAVDHLRFAQAVTVLSALSKELNSRS